MIFFAMNKSYMINKSDLLYLNHIINACKQIRVYLKNVNWNKFESEKLIQDGVMKQLEIIGEAARHVSDDTRKIYSEISWFEITGMRDRLIHDYVGVNLDIVWKTATEDVPKLEKQVNELL